MKVYKFYDDFKKFYGIEPYEDEKLFKHFCSTLYKKLGIVDPNERCAYVSETGNVLWYYYISDIEQGKQMYSHEEGIDTLKIFLESSDTICLGFL